MAIGDDARYSGAYRRVTVGTDGWLNPPCFASLVLLRLSRHVTRSAAWSRKARSCSRASSTTSRSSVSDAWHLSRGQVVAVVVVVVVVVVAVVVVAAAAAAVVVVVVVVVSAAVTKV